MDFFKVHTKETNKGRTLEVYPDFTVGRSKDLMVRGRSFYAIWDEERGMWSTDEYDVQRLVDEELYKYADKAATNGVDTVVKNMSSYKSGSWYQFRSYVSNISDNHHQLDQSLTFANTDVKKSDYVSRRLPYSLEAGDHSAWDELVGTLFSVDERAKIEWAIGAIISGDSKKIQKFLVLYGPAGTGKSTVLNIVEKLFAGYTTTFEAKALGGNNNAFATEAFKHNPLVAIQHDGDLSKIEDNTKLNSIISHEEMTMNEKYKPSYTARVDAFLFMGTNQPVKISDAKSGIIRRLIDVHPTGVRVDPKHYQALMSKVDFEIGAIAHHCLETYLDMGKNHYNAYRPMEMMLQTDVFFNFIESQYDIFKAQDGASLKQAYFMYKEFCNETGIDRVLPQYKFREELRNYFDEFHERGELDGQPVRSLYLGFNANKFKVASRTGGGYTLALDETESIFDLEYANQPAQGATKDESPKKRWANVLTTLADLDTSELHFVKVPEEHIVIDFDIRDESGDKSLERNLEAASNWPSTYAELSKSGEGVHLHYNYAGDVNELSAQYSEGIEVKTLLGDASLRRRLTKCNHVPVATMPVGRLAVKEKKLLTDKTIKSEKGLRDLIARNLKKEFHPGTKSSIDFIQKILTDAYESGISYDVSDMRPKIMAFANNSTNQNLYCLKVVTKMPFKSENSDLTGEDPIDPAVEAGFKKDDRLVFFDVEVYKNLFVVCWMFEDSDEVVTMINPSPEDVHKLFKLKLVGFNCRRYDNHILYARYLGADNMELYRRSQKIINNDRNALFGEAFKLSYADIYDYMAIKQTLKKCMIELGIHKMEMEHPWDEEVPDELIPQIVEYCCNDVRGTKATHEAKKQDFVARQILADLSGLEVNDTTAKHTAAIIFQGDRNPQSKFQYTHLKEMFPGYTFENGKSEYRGENPSEGGYVYAEPGMYNNVAVLDVASMHPTSIEQMNLFGEYTVNYAALKEARMLIKHQLYDDARNVFNGRLSPYLDNPADAKALANALKIVINSVYGFTSAKYDNPFRDLRNKDNIVAKRGALFMIDLKHFVQEQGFTVAHIKTDSIKIPDATDEIIDQVFRFGEKYGYDFEHEATYDKLCLVNDAVYIARKNKPDWEDDNEPQWDAVGAQFQHPYVYKTLFTHAEIKFDDLCETKSVQKGAIYMDYEHDTPMALSRHDGLKFVGKIGRFVPVQEGQLGAMLYRITDDKHYALPGTKGYLWIEADLAKSMAEVKVDMSYFERLADEAMDTINKFGDFRELVS